MPCGRVRWKSRSDFGGVVYETFDASGGWKSALGRELEAAGFEVDWNKVMRP